jgi:hypothetical protein
MTNENNDVKDNNVNISIEQICAAILSQISSIEIPLENLIKSYADKVIAVNQDQETKAVTFTLVDAPVNEDSKQESE